MTAGQDCACLAVVALLTSDVRLRCKCWRKGGSAKGRRGGATVRGAKGLVRQMERRVSVWVNVLPEVGVLVLELELFGWARCARGRTGAAPGVGLALGTPVSFCTVSRKSRASVSRIVVGVRRDERGRRRLLVRRDEDCRDDDVVAPVGSLMECPALSQFRVDCGSDVRHFWRVSTRDREILCPSSAAGRTFCSCCSPAVSLLLEERRGDPCNVDRLRGESRREDVTGLLPGRVKDASNGHSAMKSQGSSSRVSTLVGDAAAGLAPTLPTLNTSSICSIMLSVSMQDAFDLVFSIYSSQKSC